MIVSKKEVIEYLDKKGIKHSNVGFDYLILAILVCIEKPEYKYKTCELYKIVATQFDSTLGKVERCIRTEIKSLNSSEKNGEFIAKSADFFLYDIS